ncbi:MAG: hypothetical protein ACI9KK_000193 [Ascidiaceihabitans sp.]|jgi:hypothetical protein
MRKFLNLIPDIFDVQLDPRLEGEPFYFTDWCETQTYESRVIRIGKYKVFFEYLK